MHGVDDVEELLHHRDLFEHELDFAVFCLEGKENNVRKLLELNYYFVTGSGSICMKSGENTYHLVTAMPALRAMLT